MSMYLGRLVSEIVAVLLPSGVWYKVQPGSFDVDAESVSWVSDQNLPLRIVAPRRHVMAIQIQPGC